MNAKESIKKICKAVKQDEVWTKAVAEGKTKRVDGLVRMLSKRRTKEDKDESIKTRRMPEVLL